LPRWWVYVPALPLLLAWQQAPTAPTSPTPSLSSSPTAAFAAALADHEAGRFQAAYETFAQLLAAAAEPVPEALRWNTALAALRVLRARDAEAAIEPWRAHPDPERRAEAEFVFGLAQCLRAEQAAVAAALPDAEPMAWQLALAAQDRGIAAFVRAVQLRGDWPAAVRNVERAQRRRLEFEQQRDRSRPEASKQEQVPEPPPPPPPAPANDAEPEAALPELMINELSAAEVAQLLQRLAQKDQRKHRLRQQEQRRTTVAGERDW
jgi:hypothetical protein